MAKTFFIADTHFGHKAIIDYENRPFDDTEQMDSFIISSWNKTVSDEDRVFVIGDFSMYDNERTAEICRMLKGRKQLIMGNHDTQPPVFYSECGFEAVSPYPVIIDGFWILSHEPMYINTNMPYANIFGHVHNNPVYTDHSPQSFCVCCERTEYRPIEFDEIKRRMGLIR